MNCERKITAYKEELFTIKMKPNNTQKDLNRCIMYIFPFFKSIIKLLRVIHN